MGKVLGELGGRFLLCIRFPVEFWFQMLCRRFCFWRNLREASRVAELTLMIRATRGRSMDGWMDGWMDGSMDGWMDGWLAGWMDGWLVGWME